MPFLRAIVLLSFLTFAINAADGDRTVVKLHIVRGVPAWSGSGVDFGLAQGETVIAKPGTERDGKAPRATVRAVPVAEQPGAYRITVKGNDGSDPAIVTIRPGTPGLIELQRVAGKLPYKISLDDHAGLDGASLESIFWSAEYRAEGTLTAGKCQALLVVADMLSDGVFDRRDFLRGTAAGIDLNGDGKILGKGE
jgi:hypothetical protein